MFSLNISHKKYVSIVLLFCFYSSFKIRNYDKNKNDDFKKTKSNKKDYIKIQNLEFFFTTF